MTGSYLAELIKTSRRASTWVFLGLWVFAVVVFLYALPFGGLSLSMRNFPGDPARLIAQQAPFLLPENSVSYMLRTVFPYLGTALALMLGALSAGSEHGWGTMKMILSQKPSRLTVMSAKLLVILTVSAILSATALLLALASSLVIAASAGATIDWPSATDLLGGFGAGVLVLVMWSSLGFALGSLIRGSTIAVGLGLIYAYPVETTLALAFTFTRDTRDLLKYLPGQNANALASAFGRFGLDPRERLLFDPPLAALSLVVYAAIFLIVAALIWRSRDVS